MESTQVKKLKLSASIRVKPDSNGTTSMLQTEDWASGTVHVNDQGKIQSIGKFTSVIGPSDSQDLV